jgi:hypothetical protein
LFSNARIAHTQLRAHKNSLNRQTIECGLWVSWCLMPLSIIFQLNIVTIESSWSFKIVMSGLFKLISSLPWLIHYSSLFDRFILKWVRVMVFNATFNNISVISWQSVLLLEETRVPEENQWPAASHWQTLSHNVVSSTPHLSEIQAHNVSGDWQVYIEVITQFEAE